MRRSLDAKLTFCPGRNPAVSAELNTSEATSICWPGLDLTVKGPNESSCNWSVPKTSSLRNAAPGGNMTENVAFVAPSVRKAVKSRLAIVEPRLMTTTREVKFEDRTVEGMRTVGLVFGW